MAASSTPVAALVEMTSGIDPAANLVAIDVALGDAAAAGAAMAFLPEMSLLLDRDGGRARTHVTTEADSGWIDALSAMARRHGLWLHSGSAPFVADDGARLVNRSHVIAADGSVHARYDKIHLFDVTLPSGETWQESARYRGGDALAVVETPLGMLGLSICYDLRFGELYRALADRGATLIAVPAAFTVSTGEAHWHVLLRARAIETACHIVAAAQVGTHADGRTTFGHSLAVGPWGEPIAETDMDRALAPTRPTVICAPIDRQTVVNARAAIPLAASRQMRRIAIPTPE